MTATLAAAGAVSCAGLLLVICYRAGRALLDRRRLTRWEEAWAAAGPRWTRRR